jgi:hypothetical protein
MVYFVLLFSPEVQSLLFANVQLPALSNDSGTWAFSAASLSTTVAWSGANVSVTDGYINTSELSTATITGG